jgi:Uma2 family endonuclease
MAALQLKKPLVLFRMTSDEFCELPPSETVKLELIDGDVVALCWPTPARQHFIFQLGMEITLWAKRSGLGRVLPDTLMTLDEGWTPTPDIVFISRRHLNRVKDKRIEGPVDLAIEVLSPKNPEMDRDTKFAAYAQFGIPWYWIVDLKNRVLEEYERVGKTYGHRVDVPFDQVFSPRLFSGLIIDLASLDW